MKNQIMIDHLFRHEYGKMVSILTRIFGLHHLELIEDAVQDTFINAMLKWRNQVPDNPSAWLLKASKNRAIDLFRKIEADKTRFKKLNSGPSIMAIDKLFEEHEIEDSQLRMIFTACHPSLSPKDQIAFALKTIAGFSTKEIASALLLKEETIKKRLSRARKNIRKHELSFKLPPKHKLLDRLARVHEVLYLIFNEGFHSNFKQSLIRKDLCGEALRLCKFILQREDMRNGAGYALFALMCFHSSRIESKISKDFESIDLKHQDRSTWYFPLIQLGNEAMHKSMQYPDQSSYHIEAAIAVEHLAARKFEDTNWANILKLYKALYALQSDPMIALNIAIVHLQLGENDSAWRIISELSPDILEQRSYLYYGVKAEYFKNIGNLNQALKQLEIALENVKNETEKEYLLKKKSAFQF